MKNDTVTRLAENLYARLPQAAAEARRALGRPVTLAEKILWAHRDAGDAGLPERGRTYNLFHPDRVAMQDATAQMALLQFTIAGRSRTAVPASVHCDHLIRAKEGARTDLPAALAENAEVYAFLQSVARKYGIDFWKPGAGIIHQVVLENYAFPGGMMVGTDSHTVNAGGLGMVAVGVGGADAVDVMVGIPWELKWPKLIGVKLTGKLHGFTSPKDVILALSGILTVKGGTGAVIEYFGEGVRTLAATGKGSIANMGAEVGATCSTFPYDAAMKRYLEATGRAGIAKLADGIAADLAADPEVEANPEKFFDRVIEIDLSALRPHFNGPFSPDRSYEVGRMEDSLRESGSPAEVSAALIGSCTNSSYQDLARAASLLAAAKKLGITPKVPLLINPGSEQVRRTAERDGLLAIFQEAGATIMTNACGPCIGMWSRPGAERKEKNSIVHSFNRNFAKRADGNPNTHAFVASPEMVVAAALSGSLLFDPERDTLRNDQGEEVRLPEPVGDELPKQGFITDADGLISSEPDASVQVVIDPASDRLQKLTPFSAWNGQDITGAKLLIKVKGKCTTDHISEAGKWLRFRGHLENISQNLLIGAINSANGRANEVKNQLTGAVVPVPEAAKAYRDAGMGSVIVGDENYGEGSSREHAAMEPRFLGVRAVLVRSFARIHETNLKKQGMLALTFADPADWEKIREDDTLDVTGLTSFAPGKPLTVVAHHVDGTDDAITANHTYNTQQIGWFRAGSALNAMDRKG